MQDFDTDCTQETKKQYCGSKIVSAKCITNSTPIHFHRHEPKYLYTF